MRPLNVKINNLIEYVKNHVFIIHIFVNINSAITRFIPKNKDNYRIC